MTKENWQRKFLVNGVLLAPVLPFLYLQGQYTRWKVGRLPDAGGAKTGEIIGNKEVINFLAIGESTVAGVGANNHNDALTGQFAKFLSRKTGKTIHWNVLGVSGITIERTINELIPLTPAINLDVILVALGGNDVFKLTTPNKFRRGLNKLLEFLRKKFPESKIYLANVPMVRDFTGLPNPTKYVLSRVAKMHHFNAKELTSHHPNVFYYEPQGKFTAEHFSDGIHPSPRGYELWADEMIEFFSSKNAI